jgi:hypothetical protein
MRNKKYVVYIYKVKNGTRWNLSQSEGVSLYKLKPADVIYDTKIYSNGSSKINDIYEEITCRT